MNKKDVQRFKRLFTGNERSYGQYIQKTDKSFTVKDEKPDYKHYVNHLTGKTGLGIVPIMDNNKCNFGVIDIDDHDPDKPLEINHKDIADRIFKLGLPLTLCKSKSGDAHVYLFCAEPVPANIVRNALKRWASELGYPDMEIFPKQSKLMKGTHGNWINLPYYEGDDTKRTAVEKGGKESSFDLFLTDAESRLVTREQIEDFLVVDFPGAPPCIRRIMQGEVGRGSRNEAVYNLSVYMQKAYKDDWKERVYDLNQTIFDKPLKFAEVKKAVTSVHRGKGEYKYKCFEEPIKSFCDSEVCINVEHGISTDEFSNLERGAMPEFTNLIQYAGDPPLWQLSVDGVPIQLNTDQLSKYGDIVKLVMEKLMRVLPPMKPQDWFNLLSGLMVDVKRIETPDDGSISGMVIAKLEAFMSKVDLTSDGSDLEERKKILRGVPVVVQLGVDGLNGRGIAFRGMDFIDYLKRMKSEELKGMNLWMVLQNRGVYNSRIRVAGNPTKVWVVKLDEYNRTILDYNYNEEPSQEELDEMNQEMEPLKPHMTF